MSPGRLTCCGSAGSREVHLWQGESDTLVPPGMGRYLAAQIPRCHATVLPGEGHLLIIDRMPDLTAALGQPAPPP